MWEGLQPGGPGGYKRGLEHVGHGLRPRDASLGPKYTLSTGHRLEDNPGVRRHLVKKSSRIQGGRGSPSGLAPILRRKKKKKKLDRRPHEV